MKLNKQSLSVVSAMVAGIVIGLAGSLSARSLQSGATSAEIDWDAMPAGTICGVYMVTQSTVRANIKCNGVLVSSGCPTGFFRANLGYFEAGGGSRALIMCAKQ